MQIFKSCVELARVMAWRRRRNRDGMTLRALLALFALGAGERRDELQPLGVRA